MPANTTQQRFRAGRSLRLGCSFVLLVFTLFGIFFVYWDPRDLDGHLLLWPCVLVGLWFVIKGRDWLSGWMILSETEVEWQRFGTIRRLRWDELEEAHIGYIRPGLVTSAGPQTDRNPFPTDFTPDQVDQFYRSELWAVWLKGPDVQLVFSGTDYKDWKDVGVALHEAIARHWSE